MINFNGKIVNKKLVNISVGNRGFAYGDLLFETIKVVEGHILFWEDHYFRLMASMRILRMEIPQNFTPEFLEGEILGTIAANKLTKQSARVKFSVFRSEGGLYQPKTLEVEYIISATGLDVSQYQFHEGLYEVELFKDYSVAPNLLSTLKTNNKITHVVGSIYAGENGYANCLLLNNEKSVIEALNSNLFLLQGNTVKSPPIGDGCLNGIMRKQIIKIIKSLPNYEISESSISPFELLKADELFLTNVISGIQPITKYRKRTYSTEFSRTLMVKLNEMIKI